MLSIVKILARAKYFMININTAEFTKGITGTNPILQDPISQIVFIGRSNVGKSSVINSLTGRKSLVKSSATPGKTREINFFLINKEVYFVDLPGYGFAKMSKKQSEKLRKLILWYFTSGESMPRLVVLIIDAKVGATDLDMEMLEILREHNHNVLIVANKVDKLKKNDIKKKISEIEQKTGERVFSYSAKTKLNKEGLLCEIFSEN